MFLKAVESTDGAVLLSISYESRQQTLWLSLDWHSTAQLRVLQSRFIIHMFLHVLRNVQACVCRTSDGWILDQRRDLVPNMAAEAIVSLIKDVAEEQTLSS